jgi:hypothetical protein
MSRNYQYDVAFSFLQEDEQLAIEIANQVRDRVTVNIFVYSERQDKLVGTDGVDTFSRIFGEESRIVVVLYREQWGQTRWTRVEENAIRTRGFNEGHEFILLVPLDTPVKTPVWLPATRIYYGFDRYGIDGLASVIESRVQAVGGTVQTVTAVDDAAKLNRELNYKSRRSSWRSSQEGVAAANQEVGILFGEIERITNEINQVGDQVQLSFNRNRRDHCNVTYGKYVLALDWSYHAVNSLTDSELYVRLMASKGHHWVNPQFDINGEISHDADIDMTGRVGWRQRRSSR